MGTYSCARSVAESAVFCLTHLCVCVVCVYACVCFFVTVCVCVMCVCASVLCVCMCFVFVDLGGAALSFHCGQHRTYHWLAADTGCVRRWAIDDDVHVCMRVWCVCARVWCVCARVWCCSVSHGSRWRRRWAR